MIVLGKNKTCVNNAKECRHVASPELVLLRDLGQPSATRPLRASARLSSRSDISFCNLFTLRALNFALASTSLTAHQKPLTDAQSIYIDREDELVSIYSVLLWCVEDPIMTRNQADRSTLTSVFASPRIYYCHILHTLSNPTTHRNPPRRT